MSREGSEILGKILSSKKGKNSLFLRALAGEGVIVNKKLIFISGYAKLPNGTTAHEVYGGLILGLGVNRETGDIVECECSLVTQIAKKFIADLMVGQSLNNILTIEQAINKQYYGAAKKAIISALGICEEKFRQIQKNSDIEDELH